MMVFVYENTQSGDVGLRCGLFPFTDVYSVFSSYQIGKKYFMINLIL